MQSVGPVHWTQHFCEFVCPGPVESSGLGTEPIYEFYVVQSSGLQGTEYLTFL